MSQSSLCICGRKDAQGFWIACDNCNIWFHGKCVNVTKKVSLLIESYFCEGCRSKDPSLSIIWKPGAQPQEIPERTQFKERKIKEKNKPSTNKVQKVKASQDRKRLGKQRGKDTSKKQCANPDCVHEARASSKYCSDECGLTFNKLRYETFFLPKWQTEQARKTTARMDRFAELDSLDDDIKSAEENIIQLKYAKENLESNIAKIKREATDKFKKSAESRRLEIANSADSDDAEEFANSDTARTFCYTCGHLVLTRQFLNHSYSCHRKHETSWAYTADQKLELTCPGDENPKLYCLVQEKKTKRYCFNLESACPHHTNWQADKDEVCGCPLEIKQELEADGNYCLELKKDCQQHYHWDKMRLAQINIERIHAFMRYSCLQDRVKILRAQVNDAHGGVIGIMLHNTIEHK